jgi:hypothetical protein
LALLVTIFVLATKTDVQPNFVSGGGTSLRLTNNEREDNSSWELNKVSLEAHAKFQTNSPGYARVMAHGASPWLV